MANAHRTGIAFVGCGYVADFYAATLANHGDALALRGVYDRDRERLARYGAHHGVRAYASLDEMLADQDVRIVANLTNPAQHYAVSKRALEAGKHVYSYKPLALQLDEARALVALAGAKGLSIAGAPASVLGESAQTLWRALRAGAIGAPRLIYAELDDGMVHRNKYETWLTDSGTPWPARDEFETGCTIEHAGYAIAWLAAMFGPVRRVVSFAALLAPDKGAHTPADYTTPDFTVGCLTFDGGIAARITNSIIAPHDHRLRIFGDDGVLAVHELWDFASPVTVTPHLRTRLDFILERRLRWRASKAVAPVRRRRLHKARQAANMDFAIGLAEMAEALSEERAPRLGGDFALHVTEVSLAIQFPDRFGADYAVTSSFAPMAPMAWAG